MPHVRAPKVQALCRTVELASLEVAKKQDLRRARVVRVRVRQGVRVTVYLQRRPLKALSADGVEDELIEKLHEVPNSGNLAQPPQTRRTAVIGSSKARRLTVNDLPSGAGPLHRF